MLLFTSALFGAEAQLLNPRWGSKRPSIEPRYDTRSLYQEADRLPPLIPEGKLSDLKQALTIQRSICERQNKWKARYFGKRKVFRKEWCHDTIDKFLELISESKTTKELWEKAQTAFDWYTRANNAKIHYTGYYLPVLNGSYQESKIYNYSIYKKPENFYKPFYTRKEIDGEKVLAGQGDEIVYVDDMIEAFFLHVQGSGVVKVKDERFLVNYHDQNGQAYRSIGKYLKSKGVDPEYTSSLQGLRKYLKMITKAERDEILFHNPSYIFFRKSDDGPYGASTAKLTPGHSMAVDTRYIPFGIVGLVKAMRPKDPTKRDNWKPFARFALSQDRGGAIKGPGRIDFYWGEGAFAEKAAGGLDHDGDLYIAIVKK